VVGQIEIEKRKMLEIVNLITVIFLVILSFVFMIGSAVLVHEKKQRQRAGITDYYDQPIKKEND